MNYDMYQLRMDTAVLPAQQILNRAIHENRALSELEECAVRLAELERDRIWWESITARKAAKKPVSAWEGDHLSGRRPERGLRITIAIGERPQIFVYGTIGAAFNGLSADEFRDVISQIPDSSDMLLRIHSDGGSFNDSIAMYTMLRRRSGQTHVLVDGLAASGASIIAMAGTTIGMAEGSWMMIHESRGALDSTADAFRQAAERLDAVNDQLVEIYTPRWKGTESQLRAALNRETWYRDREAVKVGLADYVDDAVAVAAHVDSGKFKYRNTPATLGIAASAVPCRLHLRRRLAGLQMHRAV
jgi:ATP-dependent protease ClpP protease subunit